MKPLISVFIALLAIGTVNAVSVEAGTKVYGSFCSSCHGAEGKGVPGVFPALNDQNFLKTNSNDLIKDTIANGRSGTGMPAFGKVKGGPLDDAQLEDLVAFIRNWESAGAAPPPAEKPAPKLLGEELYNANCQGCHGEGGKGTPAGPALVGSKFIIESDSATVKKVIEDGRLDKGMPAWKGVLSNEQMDSLVTLIKGWKKEEIGVHVEQWNIGLLAFGLIFLVLILSYIYKIT